MNEHMIAVLKKIHSVSPSPVQKSYLYYSQAEKEAVEYMKATDLIKEVQFYDAEGVSKRGYVLGDFGQEIVNDVISIQLKISLQERIYESAEDSEDVAELKSLRRELSSLISEESSDTAAVSKKIGDLENNLIADCMYVLDNQVERLDERGNRKMATIAKWKEQKRGMQ